MECSQGHTTTQSQLTAKCLLYIVSGARSPTSINQVVTYTMILAIDLDLVLISVEFTACKFGYNWDIVFCYLTLIFHICVITGACRKPLQPGAVNGHDSSLFCNSCYGRQFGIKGYGFAGGNGSLLASEPVRNGYSLRHSPRYSPSDSPRDSPRDSPCDSPSDSPRSSPNSRR